MLYYRKTDFCHIKPTPSRPLKLFKTVMLNYTLKTDPNPTQIFLTKDLCWIFKHSDCVKYNTICVGLR